MEENIKKSKRIILALIIIISALITVVVVLSIKLGTKPKVEEKEPDAIPVMAEVKHSEYTGRNVSAEEVIKFNDYTLGQIWVPVFGDVPKSTIDTTKIKTRKTLKYYIENDEIISTVGIDVSVHQGDIDWEKVKAAGVDFAMICLGYRGYGSGDLEIDKKFIDNIEGAKKLELMLGFISSLKQPPWRKLLKKLNLRFLI